MDYNKLKEEVSIHTFVLNIMRSDLIMVNTGMRETNISEIHTGHSGIHIL